MIINNNMNITSLWLPGGSIRPEWHSADSGVKGRFA
jgi:hypothetical protein